MRRSLVIIISKLPLGILHSWANALAFLLSRVFNYRKSVVEENIKGSFPEKTDQEIKQIVREFYKGFFQVIMELFKSYSFGKKDWDSRVRIANPEKVKEYLDSGRSVILMSGHESNWEWTAFAFQKLIDQQLYFLYKPLSNPRSNELMLELRSRHGAKAIEKDKALRKLIKLKKETIAIGIVGDQLPAKGTDKYWINFLNRPTAFFTGAEKIARSLNYPVFYGRTHRLKKGYYELSFELLYDGNEDLPQGEITKRYANALESNIRKNPSEYLWSHRRWKYSPEEVEKLTGKKQLFVS